MKRNQSTRFAMLFLLILTVWILTVPQDSRAAGKDSRDVLNIEYTEADSWSPAHYTVNGFKKDKSVKNVIIPAAYDDGEHGKLAVTQVKGFRENTVIESLMGAEDVKEDQILVTGRLSGCKNLKTFDARFSIPTTFGAGFFSDTAIEEITLCYNDGSGDQGASAGFTYANIPHLKTIKLRNVKSIPYKLIDGVLYTKSGTDYSKNQILQLYPAGREDTFYNIAEGTAYFERDAFHCAANLETIYIPKGTSLPQYLLCLPFYGCSSLKEIRYGGTREQWDAMVDNVYVMVQGYSKDDFKKDLDKLTITCGSVPIVSADSLTITSLKDTYAYTGKAVKPAVKVYDGKKLLKAKTNYTVTYGRNKSTGRGTVTIKGLGNYRGTVTKEFVIVPKAVTGTKVTSGTRQAAVSWKKATGATGYEVTWSRKKASGYSKTPVTTKKLKAAVKKLTSGKTYYVKVRAYKTVEGKKYYGAYGEPVKVKIK